MAPPNQIIGGAMSPLAPPIAPPMVLTECSESHSDKCMCVTDVMDVLSPMHSGKLN